MPPFDAHKNFAYSTVSTAPSPATSGTSLTVATGTGVAFPATPFNATVWPASVQPTGANAEIIRVTAIVGDVFTITRAQESSSAMSIAVGYQIAATITAKTVTDVETAFTGTISFTSDESIKRITVTDSNVTTASKIMVSIRRPDVVEASDPGWIYIANITRILNGSFDVLVVTQELDSPAINAAPNESVTIVYHLWS